MKAAGMFRDFNDSSQDPVFSATYELDLGTVVPSLSGPKRPQDRIAQTDMKREFNQSLSNKVESWFDSIFVRQSFVMLFFFNRWDSMVSELKRKS